MLLAINFDEKSSLKAQLIQTESAQEIFYIYIYINKIVLNSSVLETWCNFYESFKNVISCQQGLIHWIGKDLKISIIKLIIESCYSFHWAL